MKDGKIFINGKWEEIHKWESPTKLFLEWFFRTAFPWIVAFVLIFGCFASEFVVNYFMR